MLRTYKCRAKLSSQAHSKLDIIYGMCTELYNAALESRIDYYKKTGKSRSYYNQCKELTQVRMELPEFEEIHVRVFRGVLERLDKAYKRFFKHGGFPRFKSSNRWHTIEINDSCWHMVGRKGGKLFLKVKGLPKIELKTNRELPPNELLKKITITRKPLRTEVGLSYDIPKPEPKSEITRPVGIDMGITKRLTMSDGSYVEKRNLDRKKLIRLQRSVARKQKGSNNRRKAVELLQKEWQRVTDKERNYLHRLTAELVKMYDFIAVEKLNTKNMLRNRFLADGIQTQTWAKTLTLLNEKAESAGVTLVEVNPKGTSQECSGCGAIVKKDLSVRVHKCSCGVELDRDINAALNILRRGISTTGEKLKESRVVGRVLKDKQDFPVRPRMVSNSDLRI